ncbi:MAG: UDP-N-acetylmuramate dehydrogenase [Lachnospira sp.]
MYSDYLCSRMEKIAGAKNVLKDEPMNKHTTFKIGGNADYLVTPSTTEQIKELVELFNKEKVPYYVIGNGSNLLVSDDGVRAVVIKLYDRYSGYEFLHSDAGPAVDKENVVYIKVQAGMSLVKLGKIAADNSLTGFEFASGIPGSIGGAVMMNAGAYGGEIKDVLVKATVMDSEGNISELTNEELELGYRTSIVARKELIVLDAVIALKPGDKTRIKEKMSELSASRVSKQPLEYPSAGSTFKRPEGNFAGKLIQEAGLKGASAGGAMVSTKHCGFVVNTGNATARDVIELTDMIRQKVYHESGVKLELEVKKMGF